MRAKLKIQSSSFILFSIFSLILNSCHFTAERESDDKTILTHSEIYSKKSFENIKNPFYLKESQFKINPSFYYDKKNLIYFDVISNHLFFKTKDQNYYLTESFIKDACFITLKKDNLYILTKTKKEIKIHLYQLKDKIFKILQTFKIPEEIKLENLLQVVSLKKEMHLLFNDGFFLKFNQDFKEVAKQDFSFFAVFNGDYFIDTVTGQYYFIKQRLDKKKQNITVYQLKPFDNSKIVLSMNIELSKVIGINEKKIILSHYKYEDEKFYINEINIKNKESKTWLIKKIIGEDFIIYPHYLFLKKEKLIGVSRGKGKLYLQLWRL